jgi:16S rRNA (cytosine1402-N4)-methyltransferase
MNRSSSARRWDSCRRAGLYLDATLGDGGHAEALLSAGEQVRLLANDRDVDALAGARVRLERFGGRVTFAHGTFRELPAAHAALGAERFAGALFDLGVSSRQIDDAARGMSYLHAGPLDLRMDAARGTTLADQLASTNETELAGVLRGFGDVVPARGRAHSRTRARLPRSCGACCATRVRQRRRRCSRRSASG